jgi:hypothetical protein
MFIDIANGELLVEAPEGLAIALGADFDHAGAHLPLLFR